MVREVHFAWDGDNGVETTLVRAAERRMTETHDWDLGEFADAIPLTPPPVESKPAETESAEPVETPAESERRKRRRRSGGPGRHLAGANWLAYMPSAGKAKTDTDAASGAANGEATEKVPGQADAER